MPVQKFKSFDDAEKALWQFHPDARYFKRAFSLLRMKIFRKNLHCPQGVFKYKTLEQAQQDAAKWTKK
ncbi:MAG TPA: hypothetical protein VJL89_04960 [Thermodesulfovibrionia bacterium]|nr:hypothetical protein [Thermodesulfovibrionia bacterium]